jgi:hypothetical protein
LDDHVGAAAASRADNDLGKELSADPLRSVDHRDDGERDDGYPIGDGSGHALDDEGRLAARDDIAERPRNPLAHRTAAGIETLHLQTHVGHPDARVVLTFPWIVGITPVVRGSQLTRKGPFAGWPGPCPHAAAAIRTSASPSARETLITIDT